VQPVGIDDRVAAGLQHLDMLHPCTLQLRHHPCARRAHVVSVFGQTGDAWNAQEVEQPRLKVSLMSFQIVLPGHPRILMQ